MRNVMENLPKRLRLNRSFLAGKRAGDFRARFDKAFIVKFNFDGFKQCPHLGASLAPFSRRWNPEVLQNLLDTPTPLSSVSLRGNGTGQCPKSGPSAMRYIVVFLWKRFCRELRRGWFLRFAWSGKRQSQQCTHEENLFKDFLSSIGDWFFPFRSRRNNAEIRLGQIEKAPLNPVSQVLIVVKGANKEHSMGPPRFFGVGMGGNPRTDTSAPLPRFPDVAKGVPIIEKKINTLGIIVGNRCSGTLERTDTKGIPINHLAAKRAIVRLNSEFFHDGWCNLLYWKRKHVLIIHCYHDVRKGRKGLLAEWLPSILSPQHEPFTPSALPFASPPVIQSRPSFNLSTFHPFTRAEGAPDWTKSGTK